MRTKTIIDGFNNSQKFRVIFKGDGSENDIGMYMTIKQMTEQFATVTARTVCWEALMKLSYMRYNAKKRQCSNACRSRCYYSWKTSPN